MTHPDHKLHMAAALAEARNAAARGEIPVGAVIVDAKTGEVVSSASNETEHAHNPTAHAEMLAITRACKSVGAPRLPDCDIYVTLEPCPMCATAISFARLRRVYFGAYDPKGGGVEHGPRIFSHATCNHKPDVMGGIDEQVCAQLLKDFFKERR